MRTASLFQRKLLHWLVLIAILLLIICIWHLVVRREQAFFPASAEIIFLGSDGAEHSMELERFLIGVVAAEMPASFDQQALASQAVAARTYIMRNCPPYGTGKHGRAAVCTDAACCQAWQDEQQLKQKWDDEYALCLAKITAAVADTAGQILLWHEQPITAAFCSTCGGSSEDSAYVWSSGLPYLVAQECGFCLHSPRYASYRALSLAQAAELLGVGENEVRSLEVIDYTPGGRVNTAQAGQTVLRGVELRQKLELYSAALTWLVVGDTVIFSAIGYGHGVGLCQYGADGMALCGYDYTQILAHYYPGTSLITVEYD